MKMWQWQRACFITRFCLTKEEVERRKAAREAHIRWSRIPYGQPVQVAREHIGALPIGTIGRVLKEEEHGVARCPGYVTLTPNYRGIRGVHVLVAFGGADPKMMGLYDLAPV
jgi:hypothetical protein